MTPRTAALLFRVARLAAALHEEDLGDGSVREQLERDLGRALRDLDGAEPGWRERTPLFRSSDERKGKR